MNRYFDRQIGTGIRQPNPNDLNRGPESMGEMTQQQGMGPGMGQVGYEQGENPDPTDPDKKQAEALKKWGGKFHWENHRKGLVVPHQALLYQPEDGIPIKDMYQEAIKENWATERGDKDGVFYNPEFMKKYLQENKGKIYDFRGDPVRLVDIVTLHDPFSTKDGVSHYMKYDRYVFEELDESGNPTGIFITEGHGEIDEGEVSLDENYKENQLREKRRSQSMENPYGGY